MDNFTSVNALNPLLKIKLQDRLILCQMEKRKHVGNSEIAAFSSHKILLANEMCQLKYSVAHESL